MHVNIYMTDSKIFLKAYTANKIDIDVIESNMRSIRKSGKTL